MEDFFSVQRKALSQNWSLKKPAYDVIIIGSGYGGAVSAARLATAEYPNGKPSVCLLERGKEWLPGSFPDNLEEGLGALYDRKDNPLGLYKFIADDDLAVYHGSGLGGTSLLNANVAYDPEPEAFDHPAWPQAIRDARDSGELAQLFERVRFTLGASQHPDGMSLSKVKALAKGAPGAPESPHFLNQIVVNFQPNGPNRWSIPQRKCLNCGDCFTGCNPGAKNTLDSNYLAIAKLSGAEIFPQVDVRHIELDPGGGYRVHYVRYAADKGPKEEGFLRAQRAVIVSGGAIGSTEVLLRSRERGLPLPKALGARFSGNADFLGIAYNGDDATDSLGWGAFPLSKRAQRLQPQNAPPPPPEEMRMPGPTIVSTIRYNSTGPFAERFSVQDTSMPLMYVDIVRAALSVAIGRDTDFGDELQEFGRRLIDFGGANPQLEQGALNHTLFYIVMGIDDAGGRIELRDNGMAKIKWKGVGRQAIFKTFNKALKRHAKKLGATFLKHPLWGFSPWRTLLTVHPLGGCPMGTGPDKGVVNDLGQVFRPDGDLHPGLYVTDGSILPAPVGVNPFVTISALSERVAEGVVRELGGTPRVIQGITAAGEPVFEP